ncbi:MAG: hypothetical protein P0Y65_08600 [Candidatus Devosia phytovorans]|uniref:Uncharacterized protein n=1 Tax=Candidatus Devosia phytovorans TaxID=3121372 RepID=A0AAJ5VZC1_9HYPH|nr:hypothetical protein [Devosia sp.]WEK06288.1 MAG: hypothetical protein P0Y65_08600 [Devosia sp.]
MQRFLLPLLVASLFATSAHAEPPEGWDVAGTYHGSGEGELSATFDRKDGDTFDVTLETVSGSCSGSIAGEMKFSLDGGTLKVANENYEEGAETYYGSEEFCEVTMSFDDDGFLNLEESSGCVNFHGAACSFDGQIMNMSAAG